MTAIDRLREIDKAMTPGALTVSTFEPARYSVSKDVQGVPIGVAMFYEKLPTNANGFATLRNALPEIIELLESYDDPWRHWNQLGHDNLKMVERRNAALARLEEKLNGD